MPYRTLASVVQMVVCFICVFIIVACDNAPGPSKLDNSVAKSTSLYHLMNEELLRGCFKRLSKDAAAGIDQMTKDLYAEDLEANLSNLVERLHRMEYIPQPVRRKYIPKPGITKHRPLGIPYFKTNLSRQDLFASWKRYTSGIL